MSIATPPVDLAALPTPLTTFVGRERETAVGTALLGRPDVRLLTLTGPGGIGKTRLGCAIAAELAESFADGVRFVPLAAVQDADLVATALAETLGIVTQDFSAAVDALVVALRTATTLLVLDNFEHLMPAAPLLNRLLASCPGLKFLITSRALLRIEGEQALSVPPLSLPDREASTSLDEVSRSSAVQLFAARARAVDPAFELTEITSPLVAGISRRLDGVPLAIELAAARVTHLPLSTLLDRLDRPLSMLSGGPRNRPTRLQTMRGAIAWSHDLLQPSEKTLFRRLAIFAGGFTLDAAEWVMGDDVFDGIASLVDSNLIHLNPQSPLLGTAGEPRYTMLATVREFAAEQLEASGEATIARGAHAAFLASLAERYEQVPFAPVDTDAVARLEAERPNFLAALTWLHQTSDHRAFLRIVGSLSWYWWLRGPLAEGRLWLERAAALIDDRTRDVRANVLLALGFMCGSGADLPRAHALLSEALSLLQSGERWQGAATALIGLGWIENLRGDYGRAEEYLEEALAIARGLDDPRVAAGSVARAVGNLGVAARGRGEVALAITRFDEARRLFLEADCPVEADYVLTSLGGATLASGDPRRAAELQQEALRSAIGARHPRGQLGALQGFALALSQIGQAESGARLFGALEGARAQTGVAEQIPFEQTIYAEAVATIRAALSEEAFVAAWAAGRALPLECAVAEALAVPLAPNPAPSEPSVGGSASLTPRELDILRLLADGRTDREIAEALFIGVRTVEWHRTNLFAKLGVSSRAAAAAYAVRNGLA